YLRVDGLEGTVGVGAGLGIKGVDVTGAAVEPDQDAGFGPAAAAFRGQQTLEARRQDQAERADQARAQEFAPRAVPTNVRHGRLLIFLSRSRLGFNGSD